jgi:hypothetical protein
VHDAATVDEYLARLPDDRRPAIERVRGVILAHLPEGYEESVARGMLTYSVPLARHPDTYNGEPLILAALASQKRYMALYLMGVYADGGAAFREAYRRTGKRLDMGKSCVRFRSLDDLPLDLIGETIASLPVEAFIEQYESTRRR